MDGDKPEIAMQVNSSWKANHDLFYAASLACVCNLLRLLTTNLR